MKEFILSEKSHALLLLLKYQNYFTSLKIKDFDLKFKLNKIKIICF